ncbi:hypothetical protein OHA04_37540 [Streptomyces sp. NBC_01590]|uniref:hypothetical protein n=1 Tax=Streptomyces sp. NBC_01590 TaxID=2975887 RepID=UPI00386C5990
MSIASNRRHRRLRSIAKQLVSYSDSGAVSQINHTDLAARLTALAFGNWQYRLTTTEATQYLDAALAERGFPLTPELDLVKASRKAIRRDATHTAIDMVVRRGPQTV